MVELGRSVVVALGSGRDEKHLHGRVAMGDVMRSTIKANRVKS